jgi:hypothetical protein
MRHGADTTDQIEPDRRREFCEELAGLVDELVMPQLDFGEDEISHEFLGAALKYRDDPDHEEAVKDAILDCLLSPFYQDQEELKEGKQRHKGQASQPFNELQITETHRRRGLIRDIAKAMKLKVGEFVHLVARDCGEPVPKCFNLTGNAPPIVPLSLSQRRATLLKPAFLIEGLIPDRTVTVAHGDTSAGKTYFALELAGAVAEGRPAFRHFKINRPGLVVFFAGEDPEDIWHNRLPAIEATYGSLDGKLYGFDYALPLYDDAAFERNLAMLRGIMRKQPISLIVNDTWRRSLGKLDANRGEVATPAYLKLENIAKEFGCAVVLTAHAPKGNSKELAGSQDLENMASRSLLIKGKRAGKQLIGINCQQGEKARFGSPIVPFTVDCQPVELDDGSSNLVLVNYREMAAAKPTEQPAPKPEMGEKVTPEANGASVDGVSADLIAEVAERYKRGEGRNQIAEALRCRRQTVSQIIAKIQQTH